MPIDLKAELQKINRDIQQLELDKERLLTDRDKYLQIAQAKRNRFRAQLETIPAKIEASHPILTEIGSGIGATAQEIGRQAVPALKRAGQFLYNNKLRVESNTAFASALKPGEERLNPQTNQYITKLPNGTYKARYAYKGKIPIGV